MKILQLNDCGVAVDVDAGRGKRHSRTAWTRISRAQKKGHLGKDRREGIGAKAPGTKLPKGIAPGRHPASAEFRGKKTQVAALLQSAVPSNPEITAEHDFICQEAILDYQSRRPMTA
jgi:hypothetical protein